jgi:DNA-binding PadR family transcriptional regulator
MRRRPGALIPLELAICEAAAALRDRDIGEFHGFLIAKEVSHTTDTRLLTAHGSLYRALSRLEKMGLLQSRWEDPQIPADENRPRRRLYTLTAIADAALADAHRAAPSPGRRKPRLAPA